MKVLKSFEFKTAREKRELAAISLIGLAYSSRRRR